MSRFNMLVIAVLTLSGLALFYWFGSTPSVEPQIDHTFTAPQLIEPQIAEPIDPPHIIPSDIAEPKQVVINRQAPKISSDDTPQYSDVLIAKAGDDFSIDENQTVHLEGFGSGPQGVKLTFQWLTKAAYLHKTKDIAYVARLAPDNDIDILSAHKPIAKFDAPQVRWPRFIDLYLLVSDEQGNWVSDSITITVHPLALPMTAFDQLDVPDEGLRRCINEYSSHWDSSFVNEARKLDCKNYQIRDLTGIEYLSNLAWLSLVNNEIEDISPLAALKKLRVINLNRNQIFDLRPLSVLKRLYSIGLANNKISEIAPLTKIPWIRELNLGHNKIEKITNLRDISYVVRLNLQHNAIEDLTPIQALTQLRELDLSDNPFKQIHALIDHPSLFQLNVSNSHNVRCVDLDTLEYSPNLQLKRQGECRL